MDTPTEEQQLFHNVTSNIAAAEHEITEPGTLSLDFINYVSGCSSLFFIAEDQGIFFVSRGEMHQCVCLARWRPKFQGWKS